MSTHFIVDGLVMETILRGPNGAVMRFLIERAQRVEDAAKHQVGVKTGDLRDSIVKRPAVEDGELVMYVGVASGSRAAPYALLHHEGTAPHDIWPKKPGGVLVFEMPAGSGNVVFASHVSHPGTQPNRYLSDNLPLAVGEGADAVEGSDAA